MRTMTTPVDNKEITRNQKRDLLRGFSKALKDIEAQTWDAWNPNWLGISPASGSRFQPFFRQRAEDWLDWIREQAQEVEEDNFDMIEFMKFAPGLLAPPDDALQQALLQLESAIPQDLLSQLRDQSVYSWLLNQLQDQSVYIWLLKQLEGIAEARDVYSSLAVAVWDAHHSYSSLLKLHDVEHGPIDRVRDNSIGSEAFNSEGDASSSGHEASSLNESGFQSSNTSVSVPPSSVA
jgi:hypothetical protein